MTRYTIPTSTFELNAQMQAAIRANVDIVDNIETFIVSSDQTNEPLIAEDLRRYIHYGDVVGHTNIEPTDPLASFVGFQKWGNLTAYGFIATTDWSVGVFALLYRDEHGRLRGYVPLEGNAFNPINNRQFGHDLAADDQIAQFLGFNQFSDMSDTNPAHQTMFYDRAALMRNIITNIQLAPPKP